MTAAHDIESLEKAMQTSDLLGQDLKEAVQSNNLLLSHIAMQELAVVGQLRSRLAVIHHAVRMQEEARQCSE